MAAYAIGDVQGCYRPLRRLLDKVNYDDGCDELWFTGDLVNRGPDSAKVVRFIKDLPQTRVVLGNHDLNLLAVAQGFRTPKNRDTFDDVLSATDCDELLDWLRHLPLTYYDTARKILLVHAGVHPHWGLDQALARAREVEAMLADDATYPTLLQRMYGSQPHVWRDEDMDKFERARWVINVFTRMRFCWRNGAMDFEQVGPPGTQPEDLLPWFRLRKFEGFRIVFGHWSMLGAGDFKDVVALDSGCVHGGGLTAMDIDHRPAEFVEIPCDGYPK